MDPTQERVQGSRRQKKIQKYIDTQIHKYGNMNTNTNIKRQEPTSGKRARILQANTTNPMMGRVPKTQTTLPYERRPEGGVQLLLVMVLVGIFILITIKTILTDIKYKFLTFAKAYEDDHPDDDEVESHLELEISKRRLKVVLENIFICQNV